MRRRLACLSLALIALGCRGPRPKVISSVHRAAPGGGSVLEVLVENTGGGEGQVQVEATLRSAAGPSVRAEREVELHAHERVLVHLPFDVAADGSYRAEVTAHYPVD
jgi:hypothetical protein